jgi:hypothetical protein
MQKSPDPIVIADLRGGRNDTDPPMSLPLNQATEYLNGDWKDTTLIRKRGGATAVSQTGGTAFSSGLQTTERHVPGAVETAAELWGIDGAATPIWKRLTGGTTWADVTVDDAVSTRPQDIVGAALNGKRFFAYDSSVDRLHVYDPNLSSPRVRRVGFATPGAPSVANTGSGGSYAAALGYWRVRWLQITGSTITRRSEPSTGTSFTPSGSNDGVVVTRPTAASEGETHWEVEVSADNAVWYQVYAFENAGAQPIVIATTTATITATVAAIIAVGLIPPIAGMHSRFPSVKFLMTDGNRLLGGGAWETSGADSSGKQSRIWHTPVLGAADKGDDERVENTTARKGWTDLNENDGGGFTGCGGPLSGIPVWFKYRQVWKLQPTGDAANPYIPRKMRDDIGCIAHKTIAIGQDQRGRAALYFLSHRGPYRVTQDGDIEYLGRDNEVTWRGMNLAASTVVAHSTYYPDLHQWWLWIATGSSNDPDVKMVFDVQNGFEDEHNQIRGGWAKHTGDSAGARCSCLFSNTIAASMSRDLKPHIGRSSGTVIGKCDTADLDDFGTDFQAYATSRPLLTTKDLLHKVLMQEPIVIGKALAGSDVSVTLTRDFGKETRSQSISLAPAASETRVVQKVAALEMGEADALQITVGDSAANEETWLVDAVIVPVALKERK